MLQPNTTYGKADFGREKKFFTMGVQWCIYLESHQTDGGIPACLLLCGRGLKRWIERGNLLREATTRRRGLLEERQQRGGEATTRRRGNNSDPVARARASPKPCFSHNTPLSWTAPSEQIFFPEKQTIFLQQPRIFRWHFHKDRIGDQEKKKD